MIEIFVRSDVYAVVERYHRDFAVGLRLHAATKEDLARAAVVALVGMMQPGYIYDGHKCATHFCHGIRVLSDRNLPDDFACDLYEIAFCRDCLVPALGGNKPEHVDRCVACVSPQSSTVYYMIQGIEPTKPLTHTCAVRESAR